MIAAGEVVMLRMNRHTRTIARAMSSLAGGFRSELGVAIGVAVVMSMGTVVEPGS